MLIKNLFFCIIMRRKNPIWLPITLMRSNCSRPICLPPPATLQLAAESDTIASLGRLPPVVTADDDSFASFVPDLLVVVSLVVDLNDRFDDGCPIGAALLTGAGGCCLPICWLFCFCACLRSSINDCCCCCCWCWLFEIVPAAVAVVGLVLDMELDDVDADMTPFVYDEEDDDAAGCCCCCCWCCAWDELPVDVELRKEDRCCCCCCARISEHWRCMNLWQRLWTIILHSRHL